MIVVVICFVSEVFWGGRRRREGKGRKEKRREEKRGHCWLKMEKLFPTCIHLHTSILTTQGNDDVNLNIIKREECIMNEQIIIALLLPPIFLLRIYQGLERARKSIHTIAYYLSGTEHAYSNPGITQSSSSSQLLILEHP